MNDVVSEARALVDVLRRRRADSQLARAGYGKLDAAAFELEEAAEDALRLLSKLATRLDAVAPLAAAAEHYRAAVAAEVEAKLRFDAERDGRGDHDAIDKARWRWVDATHAALAAQAELAKAAWDDDTRAALAARLAEVAGGER